jgi:hypothetical protein
VTQAARCYFVCHVSAEAAIALSAGGAEASCRVRRAPLARLEWRRCIYSKIATASRSGAAFNIGTLSRTKKRFLLFERIHSSSNQSSVPVPVVRFRSFDQAGAAVSNSEKHRFAFQAMLSVRRSRRAFLISAEMVNCSATMTRR